MSQTYELTGCISRIKPVQTFKSGFEKQEVVINDKDAKFPQDIAISFMRDGVKKLAEYKAGDHVTVTFAIQGREWNERNFVDLKGLKIERAVKLGGESTVGPQPAAPQAGTLFDAQAERPAPVVPDDPGANLEDIPF